jgi:hypothetical protein
MPYELGLALYELGRQSAGPARRGYLERAAHIFAKLGAAYDLARARRLLHE